MANAKRDQNRTTTFIGLSNADGSTILNVYANPTSHGIKLLDDTTGTDYGDDIIIDGNYIPVSFAVSSSDGKTLIPIYIDLSTNSLLATTS